MLASIHRLVACFALALLLTLSSGFTIPASTGLSSAAVSRQEALALAAWKGNGRFSDERRKELGINDEDDEYDLDMALENNTDPFITKVVAGSFIVTMIGLLVVGLIVPYTTDYGEGVCNPMLTSGRC